MSESENKGGQFIALQKDKESDIQTAAPTDVSQGNQGSSGGDSSGNAYPLPSEIGEREREAEAQKESSDNTDSGGEQQQSSGEQTGGEQQQSSDEQNQESGGGDNDDQKKEGGEEGEKKGKPGASRENPDSIPTAGGERLGEKHWGESKFVPDVPKSKSENVSSSEGQPDQQTKDNTAKNTGGGSSGGGGEGEGEPKQGMVDKIKDKLGLGGK